MKHKDLTLGDAWLARHDIEQALWELCEARDLLKLAGAPKTLARVRLAISSCKGAIRAAACRVKRAEK